jgi:hypothetical protein
MLFRRSQEDDGSAWVDQCLDDKVDSFVPCEICNAILEVQGLDVKVWCEGSLCQPCGTRLEIESAIADVQGVRPYNLAIEPQDFYKEEMHFNEREQWFSF